MIQVWSLNTNIGETFIELGIFSHKKDALKMQRGYKKMYHEELKLKEKNIYESISEIDINGV